MNNNNMYFSCFSLIRACVSSLFDNFFKVVAVCLIVCFVLISPAAAYASTTESIMTFANTRSIPTGFKIPFRSVYHLEDDYFYYAAQQQAVDDSSSNISSTLNLTGNVSDTLVGFTFDMSAGITGNVFNGINLSISSFDYWLYNSSNGISYSLSPFASPANAYTVIGGTYDFSFYDGSVGYERKIYDNSFAIIKPLSVQFSEFGLNYRTANGIFNPKYILGCNMNLSCDGITVDDLLNEQSVRNTIADYVEFTETEISDTTFITIEDMPTTRIEIHPEMVSFFVLFTPTSNNFAQYNDSSNKFSFSSLDNMSQTVRIAPVYSNSNRTSVDVYGLEGQFYDRSPLSLISSSAQMIYNSVGTGLSNVVSNATDNANRIIQNTTQKVDEVKQGVTAVKDSVVETKNSILDLPNKIKDMLLGLIIPSDEDIAGKYDEFSSLLEAKLGVIYQIPAMILELFQTLLSGVTDPQTTLTFPSLSLPWIDGTQMKLWDSIEFEIIPTGMDVLKELIQTVTSMVCVIMTFNSVKRIYENFLRGR